MTASKSAKEQAYVRIKSPKENKRSLEKINQKISAKEKRLTRYPDRIKQCKQNKTFLKKRKKILPTNRWRMHVNKPTTGYKGSKTILKKI